MDYALAKKLKDAGFPQREDFILNNEVIDLKGVSHSEIGFHCIYDSSCGEELEYLKKTPVKDWQGKGRATVYFAKEYLESEEGKYLTVYKPTLSELIEACGDRFNCLERMIGCWIAIYDGDAAYFIGEGITPEEAVAHLWLELNKN